MFNTLLVSP